MRSRLQQQYQAEMANKYTRDMIPFNQWLAQRNAPKMAGGGARRTLPKERADQNLAKFLEPSAVKNRLYHGTTAKEKSGQALQTLSGDDAPYRGGIETFVSTKPKFASRYAEDEGGYVLPVYAQIKNPFDYRDKHAHLYARDFWRDNGGIDQFDADKIRDGLNLKPGGQLTEEQFVRAVKNGHWTALEAPEFVEWLVGLGHDAVVTKEGGAINYGIMNSNAIKSAIGNRGTYDPNDPDITKAGGGPVVPKDVAQANLAKMLEGSHTPMRLYHGTMATEGGKGQEAIRKLKMSKEGALGAGVYMTPESEYASTYAGVPARSQLERDIETGTDFAKRGASQILDRMNRGAVESHEVGGNMLALHARITNPLKLTGEIHRDPMIEALIKLGMDPDKAGKLVENAYEKKGYVGKEVMQRALEKGHDALMQYRDGVLQEVVHYVPRMIKSATGNQGTYDTSKEDLSKAKGGSVMGVNVASDRKAGRSYADLIVDGQKTLESRSGDSLRPYVGKRVAIVRTGEGKAKAIGEVTIGEPMVVNSKQFRELEHRHMVPKNSTFDINTPTKHLYPLHNPERYDQEREVGHGIVSRKVMTVAKGGKVSQDAMMMKVMDAKMAKGGQPPERTVKAYKLFRVHPKHPGKLFPLFVNANQPVEMNKWVDAEVGPQTDTGKVKSKLGPLAYRPGWHAGDVPVATHIGERSDPSLSAPDIRPANHVWAEVEMPDDVDWQAEANRRGINKKGAFIAREAHITDQIPKGGHYRYKTNPNMTGNWLIGGSMKVKRVLTDKEVERINKAAGVADLPRAEPFNKKKFGFKRGGKVTHAHHLEIEERPL